MKTVSKKFLKSGLPIIFSLVIFVAIRLIYWNQVTEEPFSDMADYIYWGKQWASGNWMMEGQFWRAYKPPGVPLLYAGIFALTGSDQIDYLRYVQLGISIMALAFLAWQLVRTTGTLYAGLLLILSVAFSKSSVFWSFKAGTESLSEAFLYLSIATAIWLYRDSANYYKYILLALITVYATFVRPNSLPLVGILVLFPLIKQYRLNKKQFLRCLICFSLAVASIWAPWILRNYAYCGQIVPLSTQGPYTFLWEMGNVDLPGPDGMRMVVHVNQLQAEADKHFANDCQASHYAMGLVKLWVRENYSSYPEIIKGRLMRYTVDRQIDLTHVSRIHLNPTLDPLLFDKTRFQIAFGVVAAIVLSLFFIWARIILFAVFVTGVFSALFLGDARMFEPLIPLVIFMTLAPSIPVLQYFLQKRNTSVGAP
jgi:hypothetical protein